MHVRRNVVLLLVWGVIAVLFGVLDAQGVGLATMPSGATLAKGLMILCAILAGYQVGVLTIKEAFTFAVARRARSRCCPAFSGWLQALRSSPCSWRSLGSCRRWGRRWARSVVCSLVGAAGAGQRYGGVGHRSRSSVPSVLATGSSCLRWGWLATWSTWDLCTQSSTRWVAPSAARKL